MTPFDPSERDELVSAYLDNEASADERARVESDPELMERVAILGSIAAMVAQPVAIDPATRDAQIAAALAVSATAPNVTGLAAHQAKKRRPPAWVLSAAAVVLLFLAAIPFISGGSDNEDVAATAGNTRSIEDSGASDDAGDAMEANDGASLTQQFDEDAMADDGATDDSAEDDDAMDEASAVAADEAAPSDTEETEAAGDATEDAGADADVAAEDPQATPPAEIAVATLSLAATDLTGLVESLRQVAAAETVIPLTESEAAMVTACIASIDANLVDGEVVSELVTVDGEAVEARGLATIIDDDGVNEIDVAFTLTQPVEGASGRFIIADIDTCEIVVIDQLP